MYSRNECINFIKKFYFNVLLVAVVLNSCLSCLLVFFVIMSENSELTKYFGDATSQNSGFPFENIGFRQLAKNDEQHEAGSKEEPPVLVSTLFQSSGVKNNDAANFFDMIGSGGIGDLQISSKSKLR